MSQLKTSPLRANKKLAEQLSRELLSHKTKKGNPIFTRTEITNGFEISGKKKINDKWEPVVIFRYINKDGRQLIEWDQDAVTIE